MSKSSGKPALSSPMSSVAPEYSSSLSQTVRYNATTTQRPPILHGLGQNRTSIASSASITAPGNLTGNFSTYVGNCWTQWSSYWSLNDSVNAIQSTFVGGTSTFTMIHTYTNTESFVPEHTNTQSIVATLTTVGSGHGFTFTTVTYVHSLVTTAVFSASGTDTTVTSIQTATSTESPRFTVITPSATLPTPGCVLPSLVAQCQSEWEEYESGQLELASSLTQKPTCTEYSTGPCSTSRASYYTISHSLSSKFARAPSCTQASIGSSFCTTLRDNYISQWIHSNQAGAYREGSINSAGYTSSYITYPNGSVAQTSVFPTSSTLAPGCDLGCARCAITGGTVRLIYWPVTETGFLNRTAPLTAPLTAVALGTTFTSPTVYISYGSVYASDSCSGIGSTHSATIVPIANSRDLSSVWESFSDFMNPQTAFFNYTDLNTPVPKSIYDRQPQCAAWYVVVPSSVLQSIDPLWATCTADIRQLYDPPYALTEGSAAAAPTPSALPPAPATPAPAPISPPPSPQPTQTGNPSGGSPSSPPSGGSGSGSSPGSSDPSGGSSGDGSDPGSSGPSGGSSNGGGDSGSGNTPSGSSSGGGNPGSSNPSGGSLSGGSDSGSGGPSGDSSSGGSNPGSGNPSSASSGGTDPGSGNPSGGSSSGGSSPGGSSSGNPSSGGSSSANPSSSGSSPGSSPGSSDPSRGSSSGGSDPGSENPSSGSSSGGSSPGGSSPGDLSPGYPPPEDPSSGDQPSSGASSPDPSSENPSSGGSSSGGSSPAGSSPGGSSSGGSSSGDPSSGNPSSGDPSSGTHPSGNPPSGGTSSPNSSPENPSSGGSFGGSSEGSSPGDSSPGSSSPGSSSPEGSSPNNASGQSSAGGSIGANSGDPGSESSNGGDPVAGSGISGSSEGSDDGDSSGSSEGGNPGSGSSPGSGGNTPSLPDTGASGQGSGQEGSTGVGSDGSPEGSESDVQGGTGSGVSGGAPIVGGQPIAQDPTNSNGVVIGGQHLSQGQSAVISGTPVSVGPNGVNVGAGSTIALPRASNGAAGATTPIATIGGQAIQADPANPGIIQVGGTQTIQPGQTANIAGTPVAVGPNGVVLGVSSIVPIPAAGEGGAATGPIATIGGQTVQVDPNNPGAVIVGGTQTVQAGETANIGGTPIAIGSSGIIVGGSSTIPLPTAEGESAANSPIATIGGEEIRQDPSNPGAVIIGGTQTLQPGQTVNIAGTPVAAGSQGIIVGDTQSIPFPTWNSATATIGGQEVEQDPSNPNAVVIGGTRTLEPGQTANIAGTPISIGPDGAVIGTGASSTIGFSDLAPAVTPFATVGGEALSADPLTPGAVVVGGTQTLAPGQTAIVDGTTVSLGSAGIVIGSSTISVPTAGISLASISSAAIITLGSETFTGIDHSGTIVLGSQTLSVGGPAITSAGQTLSLSPSGLVIASNGLTSTHGFSTIPASISSGAPLTSGSHTYTASDHSGSDVLSSQTSIVADPPTTSEVASGGERSFGMMGMQSLVVWSIAIWVTVLGVVVL
ncbi:MAG: hypothetical protein M1820_006343 [Bogoriella megaspora]|nr:MAG: hypothetical protein M1820_006343 [Bogoriella megaspora]